MPSFSSSLSDVVRGKHSIGIQSKLLIMLLGVSVVSVLITGAIGYKSGTDSLRQAEFERVTQLRESRAREIEAFYGSITNAASVVTHGATTVNAARDFTNGFNELATTPLPAGSAAGLDLYYQDVFGKELSAASHDSVDVAMFMPTDNAARYLQSVYTVTAGGDFDKAITVADGGDGSAWTDANRRYQGFFGDLTQRFGFEDSMIIDTGGNVVYNSYKGVDLGTNLNTGPYRATELADAYRQAMQAKSIDEAIITDFEAYAPSYDHPTAWVLSPIGAGGAITGVLALQISMVAVNDVMTGDNGWEEDGLGQTGETYLAGADRTMRSVSRGLLTAPEEYEAEVIDAGTSPEAAARQVEVGGSILLQPVDTPAVEKAESGESGVMIDSDYYGPNSLVAYGPVDIPGLDWVMVAKVDEDEAMAPVDEFARRIALSTAAIVLVICLLSLVLARVFTRPLKVLSAAVREVSSGNLGATVPVRSKDEFGDLSAAFNDMSASLQNKQALIEAQQRENEELLRTLMPEPVARRYREGEENITSDYRNVSVIFAEVVGFEEFSADLSSTESLRLLNSLMHDFEGAAERHGMERVRGLRNGFLATCGLVVPRVDHSGRTTAFALELADIVEQFNSTNGARLTLRAGLDSGPVSSGLIGQKSMMYDLWGEALDLAHSVRSATGEPGVFVSERVRANLAEVHTFTQVGTIAGPNGTEPVWSMQARSR
jgi:class 3 adenylate cyclase